jgi:S1-C subfamily serine protease
MLVKKDPWGTSSYCGGVWVNEDHIVTAKHCVGKVGKKVRFQTYNEFDGQYPHNKNDKTYIAVVVALGEDVDVAVLKSNARVSHNVASIYKGKIVSGGKVHSVGHPTNLPYNYTTGTISQIRDMDVYPSGNSGRFYVLHVTTSATFGSSGSGVYDLNGELLGIAAFIMEEMPGAMFYLHRDLITEVLDDNSIAYH